MAMFNSKLLVITNGIHLFHLPFWPTNGVRKLSFMVSGSSGTNVAIMDHRILWNQTNWDDEKYHGDISMGFFM